MTVYPVHDKFLTPIHKDVDITRNSASPYRIKQLIALSFQYHGKDTILIKQLCQPFRLLIKLHILSLDNLRDTHPFQYQGSRRFSTTEVHISVDALENHSQHRLPFSLLIQSLPGLHRNPHSLIRNPQSQPYQLKENTIVLFHAHSSPSSPVSPSFYA